MGAGLAHLAVVYVAQRRGCICRAAPLNLPCPLCCPGTWLLSHRQGMSSWEQGKWLAASCPITASSQACLWHCDRAGHSFAIVLRTCKAGRPKGLGMKTSPCLHFCLVVWRAPSAFWGNLYPSRSSYQQPCRIHHTSISRYSCTACAITSSES